MKRCKIDHLLERIPAEQMSIEQKSFKAAFANQVLPWYKLLREPTHFEDFDWDRDMYEDRSIAIWRDNETMICTDISYHYLEKNVLCSVGGDFRKYFMIYGKTDAAIAETATFFWSLKHSGDREPRLSIFAYNEDDEVIWRNKKFRFDCAILTAEQLARTLDANPTRCFDLNTGMWSA